MGANWDFYSLSQMLIRQYLYIADASYLLTRGQILYILYSCLNKGFGAELYGLFIHDGKIYL